MNVIPEFHSKTRAPRRERLIEKYISALGLCSVFVGAPERQKPIKIGYNSEIVGREHGGRFIIWEREWCRSQKLAQAIVSDILSRLGAQRIGAPQNGWINIDAHHAHTVIQEVAASRGIALTPHQRIAERGKRFVECAEQKIFSLQRDGSLQEANKAFRRHRLAAQVRGEKTPDYQEFIDSYLHDVFDLAAREIIAGGILGRE